MVPERNEEEYTQESYILSPEKIKEITTALSENNDLLVKELIDPMHVADIADLLDLISSDYRESLIKVIKHDLDPELLVNLDGEVREHIIELLGIKKSADFLTQLDTEDAVQVMEDLDDQNQQELLQAIPEEQRNEVEEGLAYPDGSAGRLIHKRVLAVPMFWNVGQTIDYMRSSKEDFPEDFYDIYVTDPKHIPIGTISISKLIRSQRNVQIQDIMRSDIKTINALTDQEEVAYMFRQYGLASIPVVGDNKRLIGTIFVDDIVDVMNEEAEEDIMRMGGVYEDDLHAAFWSSAKRRFPWLMINLLTAILASYVIGLFEGTIEQIVALAVLMPIIASMGGNAGTQTLTVAVRAIASKDLTATNAFRVVVKETMVGVLNGIFFAIITAWVIWWWYDDLALSAIFAVAMVTTLLFAGLSGAVIPLLLVKMRVDPAIASSVFLTTVTDVVAFAAFLGLAAYILL